MEILYLFLAVFLVFINFQIFQSIGGILLGFEVEEIGIFIGPSLFKFNIGKWRISFNALPFGTYVKFTDDFQNAAPIRKILMVTAGLLSYLVLSFFCIGFSETLNQSISLYSQLFWGALLPIKVGSVYFEKLSKLMMENSFLAGLGITAAKMFAGNLMPLGTLSGGSLVLFFLEFLGVKSESFSEKYNLFGLLIFLPICIAWLTALAVFVLRTLGII